jgi:hypothetical protein
MSDEVTIKRSGWKIYFKRGEHKAFEIFVSEKEVWDEYGDISVEWAKDLAAVKFVRAAFEVSSVRIDGNDNATD